ncbi:MAG: hypothetical protein RSB53_08625, partial [Oscillospiraceae bacterium]
LGVLMAVLVPQYIQYVEKSRVGADEAMIGEIGHAMEVAAANQGDLTSYTVKVIPAGGTMTKGSESTAIVATDPFFVEVNDITNIAAATTKSKTYEAGITVVLTKGKATVTPKP